MEELRGDAGFWIFRLNPLKGLDLFCFILFVCMWHV